MHYTTPFSHEKSGNLWKLHHSVQWQIMETISGCWHLKVNLKEKNFLYVNSSTQQCPNKIIKTFLIEDILYLPTMSVTPVVHIELRISPLMFAKNLKWPYWETKGVGGNWHWGVGGNWVMKQTWSHKISWNCAFQLSCPTAGHNLEENILLNCHSLY